MEGYLAEQGQRVAENLARQSVLALLYHSADNVREGVATTLAFPDVQQVEITDAEHHVLLSQARTGAAVPPDAEPVSGKPLARAAVELETGDAWRFGAPVYGGESDSSPFDAAGSQAAAARLCPCRGRQGHAAPADWPRC